MDTLDRIALYLFLIGSTLILSTVLDLFIGLIFAIGMIIILIFIGYRKTGNGMYAFTGKKEIITESDEVLRHYVCMNCHEITFKLPCTLCGSRGGKMIFE